MRRIERLSEIAGDFDGFILDQWGVLHDGTRPYDGAVEGLAAMRASGKRIVILSNSGRLSAHNRKLLAGMGFAADLYDGLISAGESARAALQRRDDDAHRALGRRCFAFMRPEDAEFFEGLDVELVDHVAEAAFICVVGFRQSTDLIARAAPVLDAALARNLPMLCANPDLARATKHGQTEAPGVVAMAYENRGGRVLWHGKPHAAIYSECRRILAPCPWSRVAAIGDSLEHDIRGAASVGLASIFIPGGVHDVELDVSYGEMPNAERWRACVSRASAAPDYMVPRFQW